MNIQQIFQIQKLDELIPETHPDREKIAFLMTIEVNQELFGHHKKMIEELAAKWITPA